ncbi:lasso peptide biosynthesis B2 protein [Azospirillum sp. SYSU D00513]|uniref:lasso peptide biosynthesis B2 protein n=1 Tax=Azospirillum sp. SYSU D00513 TaxID=2812561 RepID=UPI001A971D9F
MAKFARKVRSFLRQPLFIRLWFLPLWILLGLSKLLIIGVPFRLLAPRLGNRAGVYPWVPLLDPQQEKRARLVGHAVRLAARYTPWNSNCFPQAVSARLLLGFYEIPYALCFGLMRESRSGEMRAHAWVVAGKVDVTGGASFGQFSVVGCFIAPYIGDT